MWFWHDFTIHKDIIFFLRKKLQTDFPWISMCENKGHKTTLISPQTYSKQLFSKIATHKGARCTNILLEKACTKKKYGTMVC